MKTKFLSIIIATLFASLSMSAGEPARRRRRTRTRDYGTIARPHTQQEGDWHAGRKADIKKGSTPKVIAPASAPEVSDQSPTPETPPQALAKWDDIKLPTIGKEGTSAAILTDALKEATTAEGTALTMENLKTLAKTKRIYILETLSIENWKDAEWCLRFAQSAGSNTAQTKPSFEKILIAILAGTNSNDTPKLEDVIKLALDPTDPASLRQLNRIQQERLSLAWM